MSDSKCLSCGVGVYSLTSNPAPKLYVCGTCAKTLSKAEIIALVQGDELEAAS